MPSQGQKSRPAQFRWRHARQWQACCFISLASTQNDLRPVALSLEVSTHCFRILYMNLVRKTTKQDFTGGMFYLQFNYYYFIIFNSPGLHVHLQDTEPQTAPWCAGWHLAWQPPPSVYECVYVWVTVSRFQQKCLLNVNCITLYNILTGGDASSLLANKGIAKYVPYWVPRVTSPSLLLPSL